MLSRRQKREKILNLKYDVIIFCVIALRAGLPAAVLGEHFNFPVKTRLAFVTVVKGTFIGHLDEARRW